MTEIFISSKNTFLSTSSPRLTHKRTMSDGQLGVKPEDLSPVYSVKEDLDSIPSDVSDAGSCENQPVDCLNLATVVESFVTGQTMSVSIKGDLSPSCNSSSRETVGTFSLGIASDCDTSDTPSKIIRRISTRDSDSDSSVCATLRKKSSLSASFGKKKIADLVRDNPVPENKKTTIMVKNVPCRYSQEELLTEVSMLQMPVNFLYLPPARHSPGNLGYAFINFVKAAHAAAFIEMWEGHVWYFQPKSNKRGSPCYATLQGFAENVEYYSKTKISKTRARPFIKYSRRHMPKREKSRR